MYYVSDKFGFRRRAIVFFSPTVIYLIQVCILVACVRTETVIQLIQEREMGRYPGSEVDGHWDWDWEERREREEEEEHLIDPTMGKFDEGYRMEL